MFAVKPPQTEDQKDWSTSVGPVSGPAPPSLPSVSPPLCSSSGLGVTCSVPSTAVPVLPASSEAFSNKKDRHG